MDAACPPVPPQRIIPVETPPPPPRGDTPENDGPFVFGVHHPNTFTPAYNSSKAGGGTSSADSSVQVGLLAGRLVVIALNMAKGQVVNADLWVQKGRRVLMI